MFSVVLLLGGLPQSLSRVHGGSLAKRLTAASAVWYRGVVESTNLVLLWITLITGTAFTMGGVLGWVGWVSVSHWARWTRANRAGGRNQVLFGLVMISNNVLAAVPALNDLVWLSVVLFVALGGFFALSILHRRRYGSRPAADSPYASKRLW